MRSPKVLIAVALLATGLLVAPGSATTARQARLVGADISWPQCPKGMGIPERQGEDKPMPRRTARFVVLGLTNGPGFHPNPCLKRQVGWVRRHHLLAAAYAVTTYPTPRQLARHGDDGPHPHRAPIGRLWNTGYAQARFNLATMREVHLTSPIVWVDVEPYSVRPWTGNRARNSAVVDGAVRAYRDAGLRVGFYSTQLLWRSIVGDLRYGYPEWRTAGPTSMTAALAMCSRHPIQGGHAVIAQWWNDDRDFGVTCPGHATKPELRRWFHRY